LDATKGTLVLARIKPPRDGDSIVARPRGSTTEQLRVVADTTGEPAVSASSKPDPRLVNLVRLLARQAARDFVQAETDRRKLAYLPE
jgi:hypothetical protein